MIILIFIILGTILLGLCALVIYVLTKSKKQQTPVFAHTQGTIKECNETAVVIHYTVNEKTYQLTETLHTREEAIKVGEVTVGHKKVPIVKAYVGQTIVVAYNTKDHAQAYWVANHSMHA